MNLNQRQRENYVTGLNPIFRSDSFGYYSLDQSYMMMEKRQLFLRSYQFCRKKSLTERVKGSLIRVKRVIWLRLRSARRLRKLVFSRFKCGFYYRKRRFLRLLNNHHYKSNSSSSTCFW
ncbi:Lamin tail domain-containing protein [Quillaja saponaria]|uniref:Lamin tail domain-containing protein n=1 Tax=Quillaja saponaria TaxID=32244 RepID=A0AAD7Q1M5_QUISA|nr:Lamin tail domain-containing protein [Quillaja saponaria]